MDNEVSNPVLTIVEVELTSNPHVTATKNGSMGL
jgi:hypothetical protein